MGDQHTLHRHNVCLWRISLHANRTKSYSRQHEQGGLITDAMNFKTFLLVRSFMALISWGYFVPDETWQSVEVAHKLVFNHGYQTWEWNQALRSYLHPIIFAVPMKFLQVLQWDSPYLVVLIPKLVQALISALSDTYALQFHLTVFGSSSYRTFAALYTTNWFLLYASSRTLINTLETCLSTVALSLYVQNSCNYVFLIAISFMMRPTTGIFWIPMVLTDIAYQKSMRILVFKMIPQAILVILGAITFDSYMYGYLVIIPWNFFSVNLLHDVSAQYGLQPVHWYLTNFFPALLLVYGAYPLIKGMREGYQHSKVILLSLLSTLMIYSFLGHKEHRFLMPIIPIILAYISLGFPKNSKTLLSVFCGLNVILALYLSVIHQAAPHAVMEYLSVQEKNRGVLFLTPCHGTPFYSHLHKEVPMEFLQCPPDLGHQDYENPNDMFFEDPARAIKNFDLNRFDYVVLYENVLHSIEESLNVEKLKLCRRFWHTHFPDSQTSAYLILFCRHDQHR